MNTDNTDKNSDLCNPCLSVAKFLLLVQTYVFPLERALIDRISDRFRYPSASASHRQHKLHPARSRAAPPPSTAPARVQPAASATSTSPTRLSALRHLPAPACSETS